MTFTSAAVRKLSSRIFHVVFVNQSGKLQEHHLSSLRCIESSALICPTILRDSINPVRALSDNEKVCRSQPTRATSMTTGAATKNQDLSGKFDSNSTFETSTSIAISNAEPGCRKGNLRLNGGCLNCRPSPKLLPEPARVFASRADSIG